MEENTKQQEYFRNQLKEYLYSILTEALETDRENVTEAVNFQAMGVDSIISLELSHTMEKYFGKLPASLFYNYRDVEELTEYLYQEHLEKIVELFSESKKELLENGRDTDYLSTGKKAAEVFHQEETRLKTENMEAMAVTDKNPEADNSDIAVIGIAGRYPGAANLAEFWDNLTEGKNCITEIPKERWDWARENPKGNRWGGFIEGVSEFDAEFFQISEEQAREMDPQERLLLEITWNLLEVAGYPGKMLSSQGERVGVFAGLMYNTYGLYTAKLWENNKPVHTQPAYWMIPNRLSYYFDFKGPSLAVDTACSSSLTAIHLACNSIKNKESTAAIVCGVNLILHPLQNKRLDNAGQLSRTGENKSFSDIADGYVEGEGVGALLLKPLDRAIKDNDNIYGIIKGSAVNHNGNTAGFTIPRGQGQAEVIKAALEKCCVNPETIAYIEAQGTGTVIGDAMELEALSKAFGNLDKREFCPVGSVKSNVGHLEAASGICALTKVLLQYKHGKLVPSIHCRPISTKVNMEESPFYIQEKLEDWKSSMGLINNKVRVLPKRVLVNSFGAGGTNVCLILEDFIRDYRKTSGTVSNLFVFSARNRESLINYLHKFKKYILDSKELENTDFTDIAYTLQVCRMPMEERIAFIAADMKELLFKLELACEDNLPNHHIYSGVCKKADSPPMKGLDKLSMEELAKAWVEGLNIDWKDLFYSEKSRYKLSLPGYQFQRKKYWLDTVNMSLKSEYTWDFTAEDIFVKNHTTFGKNMLPGSVLCCLALEVCRRYQVKTNPIVIKNFTFQIPFVMEGMDAAEICCSLQKHNITVVGVKKNDIEEKARSLAQGEFSVQKSIMPYTVEIPDFSIYDGIPGGNLYRKKPGIYGSSLQVVKEVVLVDGYLWSKLSLPEEMESLKDTYFVNPAVLEGAFTSRLGFKTEQEHDKLIPLMIEEIIVFHTVDNGCCCRLQQTNSAYGFWRGNIEIFDQQGNIRIILLGCTFKSFENLTENLQKSTKVREIAAANTDFPLAEKTASVEKIKQYLWYKIKNILGNERTETGAGMDFMALGLESVQLIALANDISQELHLALYPTIFFEYSNMQDFAYYLADRITDKDAGFLDAIKNKSPELKEVEDTEKTELQSEEGKVTIAKCRESVKEKSAEGVAIIGFGAVLPQSDDREEFWNKLISGEEFITEMPEDRMDSPELERIGLRTNTHTGRKGGFLKDIKGFDAAFFGMSPREAELMDPQQRLALELTWKAIEDAGYNPKKLAGSNTGVFIGVSGHDYKNILDRSSVSSQAQAILGNAHNVLTGRISYMFDFHGPSEPVDNACASSLAAMHRGVECIRNGSCGLVIAGGINIIADGELYQAFGNMGILSKEGSCKAFDEAADGTVRGEGGAVVVLKSLPEAVKDKDNIYAIIKGSSVNHGGRSASLTAPNMNQQADVIEKALKETDLDPTYISYIEAHGTGTKLGDPIEMQAVIKAYEKQYRTNGHAFTGQKSCGIGTVKASIGHLEAAAGMAGVIKILLSMKTGIIPGTANFKNLNQYIKLEETPFYIVDKTVHWIRSRDSCGIEQPYRAQVQSFGLSGVNACLVLEEYIPAPEEMLDNTNESCIIVLSAKNESVLKSYAAQLKDFLSRSRRAESNFMTTERDGKRNTGIRKEEPSLTSIAYTLQVGREAFHCRLAILTKDKAELIHKLQQYIDGEEAEGVFTGCSLNEEQGLFKALKGNLEYDIMESLLKKKDYVHLAGLWSEGLNVNNWESLYSIQPGRVSLPTYPFEKQQYWVTEIKNSCRAGIIKPELNPLPDEMTGINETLKGVNETQNSLKMRLTEDIIRIVSSISHVDSQDINITENLEDQGFDSITLTELADLINEKFATEVTPALFFEIENFNIQRMVNFLLEGFQENINKYYAND